MARHPNIPEHVVDAALERGGMIERFYTAGGGSRSDLVTDLSHALAVLLDYIAPPALYAGPERRASKHVNQATYAGPERRKASVRLP